MEKMTNIQRRLGRLVMTDYKWHEVYKAALLETDRSKMEKRIQAAEAAFHERKREFDMDHGGTLQENQAIDAALRGLGVLRNEVARWHKNEMPDRAHPVTTT